MAMTSYMERKVVMDVTSGSITQEVSGVVTEDMFFTYSEVEKQQNEINAENARRVFSPKFIPWYPVVADMGLTMTECLLYGFIDFYLSTGTGRFYFTDEQLSSILRVNPKTIQRSMRKLKAMKLVNIKHKVRAGGGTIRFAELESRLVQNIPLGMPQNVPVTVPQNVPTNKNKIKDNKINKKNTNTEKGTKGNRGTVSRSSANASNSDVSSLKEKYTTFISLFNDRVGSKYRGDSKSERQFRSLYKSGVRGTDFARVIEQAVRDDFLMGKNEKGKRYLTPEYITRSDKFSNYLSLADEKDGVS